LGSYREENERRKRRKLEESKKKAIDKKGIREKRK
jgi:hypothetical protein